MAAPLFGLPDSNTAAAIVTRFVGLSDVPASYAGQALKGVRVNAGETALEFAAVVTTFVALTDGPGAFSGNALKSVRVNAGATALEYYTVVSTFVALTDGPGAFSGNALKAIRVNAGATALEYFTISVSFIGLTDVPASFSGAALKYVRVNAGATALEFQTFPTLVTTFIALSDVPASYSGQSGKLVRVNSGETALEFATVSAGIGNEITFADTVPSAPSAGNSKHYSLKAGVSRLAFIQPDGNRFPVQPSIAFLNLWELRPMVRGLTAATLDFLWMGMGPAAGTGTSTFSGSGASTNYRTSSHGMYVTGTTGDSVVAGFRGTNLGAWMGNAAGRGGFFFHARFGLHAAGGSVATNFKFFIGLDSVISEAAGTTQPSARVSCLGIGCEAADANVSIYHNDSSGAATMVATSSSYPARNTTAVYDFYMYVAPNDTTVEWYLVRADTGSITSGSFSSDIPSNTTFLTPHFWVSNGASAGGIAPVIFLPHAYMEFNP